MGYLRRLSYVLMAGFVGLMLYATYPVYSSLFASTPTTFTPENWRDAHQYRREIMANDFLAKYRVVGMSRDEVLKLLGKPDQQSPGYLSYFVAITAADYMVLTFELDTAGFIAKAYIRQS